MKKLNGWQRIGVVLSVLWALIASGIIAGDYHFTNADEYCVRGAEPFVYCTEEKIVHYKPNKSAPNKQNPIDFVPDSENSNV